MAERTPLNGREMQTLEYMMVIDHQLSKHPDALRARLAAVPNGWRQLRLIGVTMDRLLSDLLDTLPIKNLKHLQQIAKYGEMIIRLSPAARTPEQALVWDEDLQTVINTAMAAECAMCLRTPAQIKGCKLRKALTHVAPAYEDTPGRCPYRDVAVASELGEYV